MCVISGAFSTAIKPPTTVLRATAEPFLGKGQTARGLERRSGQNDSTARALFLEQFSTESQAAFGACFVAAAAVFSLSRRGQISNVCLNLRSGLGLTELTSVETSFSDGVLHFCGLSVQIFKKFGCAAPEYPCIARMYKGFFIWFSKVFF